MTAAFAAAETFPFPDTLEIARWVGKGDRAARLTGPISLSILLICVLIFVLFMVAGYAGLALQTRLVDEHKTGETKAVVGQVSGLVSLLLALVLGTLIGVSWAYFSAQRTNLENFSAQVLRLDQALGQFGPETKPMRDQLKAGIEKAYGAIWGGGTIDPAIAHGRPAPRQCARRQRLSRDASAKN